MIGLVKLCVYIVDVLFWNLPYNYIMTAFAIYNVQFVLRGIYRTWIP
jgi:hypothetical protein